MVLVRGHPGTQLSTGADAKFVVDPQITLSTLLGLRKSLDAIARFVLPWAASRATADSVGDSSWRAAGLKPMRPRWALTWALQSGACSPSKILGGAVGEALPLGCWVEPQPHRTAADARPKPNRRE